MAVHSRTTRAFRTPRDIVAKHNAELTRILNTQNLKEKLAAQGTEVRTGTPESFVALMRDENAPWANVVKESGAKFNCAGDDLGPVARIILPRSDSWESTSQAAQKVVPLADFSSYCHRLSDELKRD